MKKGSCKDVLINKTTNESLACLGEINALPLQNFQDKNIAQNGCLALNKIILGQLVFSEYKKQVFNTKLQVSKVKRVVSNSLKPILEKVVHISTTEKPLLTNPNPVSNTLKVLSTSIKINSGTLKVDLPNRKLLIKSNKPFSNKNKPVWSESIKDSPKIMPFITDNAVSDAQKKHHLIFHF